MNLLLLLPPNDCRQMPIITLTTDSGNDDFYVGALKGKILSMCPDAQIVDITHQIPPHDIIKAAFVLKNIYQDFPKGTIHIVGVDRYGEDTKQHIHLAIQSDDQYFIGADSGIFSIIFDIAPQKVVNIATHLQSSFPTKEIYAPAACHLAKKGKLEDLGQTTKIYNERSFFNATTEQNMIVGTVAYTDHYGNLITNINWDLFESFANGRSFNIYLRGNNRITRISSNYHMVPDGEKVAIFNDNGYLEIAIKEGNAAKLLGMHYTDKIRIEFE